MAGAPGEQEDDRLVPEPASGEGERGGGGRIEPLDVVDGDEERPASGQRSQRVEQTDGDRLRLGRLARGSARRSATSSARRCGAGSPSASSVSTSSRRSTSAPNENCASASVGRAESTRNPCALASATPVSQSVVLPIPAPPANTRARGVSSRRRNASSTATSGSRPTTDVRPSPLVAVATVPPCHLSPVPAQPGITQFPGGRNRRRFCSTISALPTRNPTRQPAMLFRVQIDWSRCGAVLRLTSHCGGSATHVRGGTDCRR